MATYNETHAGLCCVWFCGSLRLDCHPSARSETAEYTVTKQERHHYHLREPSESNEKRNISIFMFIFLDICFCFVVFCLLLLEFVGSETSVPDVSVESVLQFNSPPPLCGVVRFQSLLPSFLPSSSTSASPPLQSRCYIPPAASQDSPLGLLLL